MDDASDGFLSLAYYNHMIDNNQCSPLLLFPQNNLTFCAFFVLHMYKEIIPVTVRVANDMPSNLARLKQLAVKRVYKNLHKCKQTEEEYEEKTCTKVRKLR